MVRSGTSVPAPVALSRAARHLGTRPALTDCAVVDTQVCRHPHLCLQVVGSSVPPPSTCGVISVTAVTSNSHSCNELYRDLSLRKSLAKVS